MKEHVEWVEKYRPKTVADCILPKHLSDLFAGFVKGGSIKNMMLYGGPGTGKTTIARALCHDLDVTPYFVNSSLSRNIDELRTNIQDYASAGSLINTNRKAVILDEGDWLNRASSQPALRGFIEKYSRSCAFILTCNYPNRIMPELRSRFSPQIEFTIPTDEKALLAKRFFDRAVQILKQENIKFDARAVATIVKHYFPDYRRVLNELQGFATAGSLDTGILSQLGNRNINALYDIMQAKDFFGLRKWSVQNGDFDSSTIFTDLYDVGIQRLQPTCLPWLGDKLNDGQFRDSMVADRELNLMATLNIIMGGIKFKE